MKRERSKVHNHSTSQVISRSSTPTNNLISSKDYVNYSSLSLTQLHYTFGSAAYKLHDGLYGCIVILTIVFCVGQSFLVYGEVRSEVLCDRFSTTICSESKNVAFSTNFLFPSSYNIYFQSRSDGRFKFYFLSYFVR